MLASGSFPCVDSGPTLLSPTPESSGLDDANFVLVRRSLQSAGGSVVGRRSESSGAGKEGGKNGGLHGGLVLCYYF